MSEAADAHFEVGLFWWNVLEAAEHFALPLGVARCLGFSNRFLG